MLGIGLSVAGVGLVLVGDSGAAPGDSSLGGALLVLGGCVCWALYTVLLQPITQRVRGLQVSALTMLGGAIPLVLMAVPQLIATRWTTLHASAWGAILYSGIGALVIAYLFFYRGVRVLGPTRTAMFGNLQPVIALIVAWLFLGEVPTVWQMVGTGSIMSGIFLTRP
jgi:drug/metabolite transporter (DMT)-like permease